MNHNELSSRLLTRLRRETNGAVVADMEKRGVRYRRNYGVSQHVIRTTARQFGPDHEFARHLWLQPVRELKLSAPVIAEPGRVTAAELPFWFDGLSHSELAENLATFLLSKTSLIPEIMEDYCSPENKYRCYAALLTAGRAGARCVGTDKLIGCCEAVLREGSPMLLRAAGLLLSRASAENDPSLHRYIDSLRSRRKDSDKILLEEII